MSSLLSRFSVDPSKMDPRTSLIILGIWLVVVACAVSSILVRQPRFDARQRWFWILLVVCVPVFGLLAYLPFSFRREGYSFLRKTKQEKDRASMSVQ
jgi:hypothetical protein